MKNHLKNTKYHRSTKFVAFNFVQNSCFGKNCLIFASKITNCIIEDDVEIVFAVLENSHIKSGTKIGPFSYVRENSEIGKNCRIGDFVEIKKSTIKDGTKSSHHAYVGDAFVDTNTNIGCGTVFANYNGKTKQKIFVGKNCFIGANTNLVAPLTIKDNCFIGAGTTVRKNLEANTFYVSKTEEKICENKFKKSEENSSL